MTRTGGQSRRKSEQRQRTVLVSVRLTPAELEIVQALAAVAAGNADGIGVMLLDAELAAADLDHCRDPITGKLIMWAERLCVEAEALGLYR